MDRREARTNGSRARGQSPPSRKKRGKGGATDYRGLMRKGWASPLLHRIHLFITFHNHSCLRSCHENRYLCALCNRSISRNVRGCVFSLQQRGFQEVTSRTSLERSRP